MNKKIAIIGAGTSGYLSVLYFCTKYPNYNITWIYPEDNNPIGVGEGTVPQMIDFLADLGIPLKTIIKEIGGSLKLGIKFENFLPETFYHPFGGPPEEKNELVHMMMYNKIPNDIENYDISFHFTVDLLSKFFDKWFKRFNNLKIQRKYLESIDEVDCDWIIDCTGFKRAIVNQYYKDNFVELSDIPNNKALVYRTSIPEHKRLPYTTCIGMQNGWIWNIPLKDEIGIGYVHDDKYDVRNEFLDYLEAEGFGRPEIREVPMITGRNKKHYIDTGNKKIVSVGLSSAFIEPLEATGLWFTVYGIQMVNDLMHGKITENEYNDAINYEFDVTADFIKAHYKFSHNNSEYWNFYKNVSIPNLYKRNNTFFYMSWAYVLQNKNLLPESNFTYLETKHKDSQTYSKWLANYLKGTIDA